MAKRRPKTFEESRTALMRLYMELVDAGMPGWTFIVRRTGYVGTAGIAAVGDDNAAGMLADHLCAFIGFECKVWANSSANANEKFSADYGQLGEESEAPAFGVGKSPAWAILRAGLLALRMLKPADPEAARA